jgi:hypothetical protein
MRAAIRDYSRLPLRIDPSISCARRLREPVTPLCCYPKASSLASIRPGGRIEIDRKSRVDGASRNEIANLPIREFAKWKHLPHGDGHFDYRNARIVDMIDQVADNRLPNIQ